MKGSLLYSKATDLNVISSPNPQTETFRIMFDHISEYQNTRILLSITIYFLVKARKRKKKKEWQEIKESTESEVKMQITNMINEINDITTDPKDIKMIRKYYEQLYIYNFDNTIGRY